jgi:hypothetical protein
MEKMCIVDRYKLCCENCINGQDYGDSVEYIWCERLGKRRKSVKKTDSCEVVNLRRMNDGC